MSIAAYTLIDRLSALYGDPITYTGSVMTTNGVRLYEADWLEHLNSAALQIVLVRPDANSVIACTKLVAGTKQTVPATAHRLLDVIRNMGALGITAGKPITQVSRQDMDSISTLWHSETGETVIDHFCFDPRSPRMYYVTPPVHISTYVYVEILTSNIPTSMTSSADNIPLPDLYRGPLMDWALYLAYQHDTDSPGSMSTALHYYKSFYQSLGIDLEGQAATAPTGG